MLQILEGPATAPADPLPESRAGGRRHASARCRLGVAFPAATAKTAAATAKTPAAAAAAAADGRLAWDEAHLAQLALESSDHLGAALGIGARSVRLPHACARAVSYVVAGERWAPRRRELRPRPHLPEHGEEEVDHVERAKEDE